MRRALAAALALLAGPAAAECRVALAMAVDVSSSVDAAEYRLQVEGLASAFEHPDVHRALFQIPGAHVSILIYEWSGIYDQAIVVDWTAMETAADAMALALHIRGHDRAFRNAATGLGQALAFGFRQLQRAPPCGFLKIDVSGDGQNNVGLPPQTLYTRQDFGGVTVNGLAIQSDETALGRYYGSYVIRGPGAFVEIAESFEDYGEAIRAKLIRELGVPQLGMR